jgi:hypothetical protein
MAPCGHIEAPKSNMVHTEVWRKILYILDANQPLTCFNIEPTF